MLCILTALTNNNFTMKLMAENKIKINPVLKQLACKRWLLRQQEKSLPHHLRVVWPKPRTQQQ